MIVLDANLLIYAVNRDAPEHRATRRWLEATLAGARPVGLSWTVILAFLRVTTRRGIFERPLSAEQALGHVASLVEHPRVRLLAPTPQHWGVFQSLLRATGTAGNLTSDAHLAALTIEHGGRLASADGDFRRFAGLDSFNPIA